MDPVKDRVPTAAVQRLEAAHSVGVFIEGGTQIVRQYGHDRIMIAPLYPQYSASTTGTALDKAYEALAKMRLRNSAAPPAMPFCCSTSPL